MTKKELCRYCKKGTLRTTVRCSFDMEFRKVKHITKKAIRSKELELGYVSFTDYCPNCGFHSLMDDADIVRLQELLKS